MNEGLSHFPASASTFAPNSQSASSTKRLVTFFANVEITNVEYHKRIQPLPVSVSVPLSHRWVLCHAPALATKSAVLRACRSDARGRRHDSVAFGENTTELTFLEHDNRRYAIAHHAIQHPPLLSHIELPWLETALRQVKFLLQSRISCIKRSS